MRLNKNKLGRPQIASPKIIPTCTICGGTNKSFVERNFNGRKIILQIKVMTECPMCRRLYCDWCYTTHRC